MSFSNKMRRKSVILLLFCLCGISVFSRGLSSSLRLEGTVAVYRAMEYLIKSQASDGSWCGEGATTGLVLEALLAGGQTPLEEVFSRGRNYLSSFPFGYSCLRLNIRLGERISQELALFQMKVRNMLEWDTLWLASSLVPNLAKIELAAANVKLANFNEREKEVVNVLTNAETASRALLLARPLMAVEQCRSVSDAYWSCRVLHALEASGILKSNHWRNAYSQWLLERQKPDGTWQNAGDKSRDCLNETSYGILCLAICQMDGE